MNQRGIAVIRGEQKELTRLTTNFRDILATYELTKQQTDHAAQTEVQAFVEVGNALRVLKGRLGHGKWLDWLGGNFKWSAETARRWMRVAAWAEANQSHVNGMVSVAMLMRLSAEDRRERVKDEVVFTLSVALRYTASLKRLQPESVLSLSPSDQYELRQALQPAHELFLQLPSDPTPAAPS